MRVWFSVAAVLCLVAGPALAGKAPSKGEYLAQIWASSVNDENACVVHEGSSFSAIVSYDGLSGTSVQVRSPAAPSPAGPMSVSTLTLTLTAGIGSLNPSGKSAISLTDPAASFSGAGTFAAQITEATSKSFLVDLAVGYQLSGGFGKCAMDLSVALAKL